MATAKKLPSGKYRCLIFIGMENGKRKYKSFTANTKREAEKLAVNYQADLDEKQDTVKEMIDNYIKSKEKVLSQTTLKAHIVERQILVAPNSTLFYPFRQKQRQNRISRSRFRRHFIQILV